MSRRAFTVGQTTWLSDGKMLPSLLQYPLDRSFYSTTRHIHVMCSAQPVSTPAWGRGKVLSSWCPISSMFVDSMGGSKGHLRFAAIMQASDVPCRSLASSLEVQVTVKSIISTNSRPKLVSWRIRRIRNLNSYQMMQQEETKSFNTTGH